MAHNWGKGRKKHVPTTLRNKILTRDSHTCQLKKPGCTHQATEVDHKQNLATGGTNHPANLQAVCHNCHKQKTQQEAATARTKKQQQAQYPQQPHPAQKTIPTTDSRGGGISPIANQKGRGRQCR